MAAALRDGLFCHVKGQQHRSCRSTVRRDPANVKLNLPVVSHRADFAVSSFQRGLNGEVDLMVTVYHKEVLPNAGAACMEDRPRSGVDA